MERKHMLKLSKQNRLSDTNPQRMRVNMNEQFIGAPARVTEIIKSITPMQKSSSPLSLQGGQDINTDWLNNDACCLIWNEGLFLNTV